VSVFVLFLAGFDESGSGFAKPKKMQVNTLCYLSNPWWNS